MPQDAKLREEFENVKKERKKYNETSQKGIKEFFSKGIYNEKEAPITKSEVMLPSFDPKNP